MVKSLQDRIGVRMVLLISPLRNGGIAALLLVALSAIVEYHAGLAHDWGEGDAALLVYYYPPSAAEDNPEDEDQEAALERVLQLLKRYNKKVEVQEVSPSALRGGALPFRSGVWTVPQVFLHGVYIGGVEEFEEWEGQGLLRTILEGDDHELAASLLAEGSGATHHLLMAHHPHDDEL
ncbi:hypothetical protein QOT17_020066 [Balamuthia mandrillaris]